MSEGREKSTAKRASGGGASRRATPPANALIRYCWQGRIEAEYRSSAITQTCVLWMIQIGASPDLIRDGLAIVDDELTHAELSREVWSAAGGVGAIPLDRETLRPPLHPAPLEVALGCEITRAFCLGETAAVPLFSNLRKGTSVPVARRALDRILRDETRHRAFGWTALAWLLGTEQGPRIRATIEAGIPRWRRELEGSYGNELESGIASVSEAERAWGVAPWSEYREILHRTDGRDYAPRFGKLGIAYLP